METTIYRLKFKTQLHLGRATGPAQTGKLGLEKTETYIPADTLFSAICQTWATFYDTASLTDFLNPYTAENGTLPFTLTSAFPFAANVYFFPKPVTFQTRSKKSKRVQFVSDSIFRDIIAGNPPNFDEDSLINSENVWISADEKDQLKALMDANKKVNVWETDTRPRVTIGALNAGSEIWHVQTVQLNKKCGLWFAAKFDSDETKHTIETLLEVLGDSGIGGERNAGYGAFDFDTTAIEIPNARGSNQSMTLSPICPKSANQLEHLIGGNVAYTLNPLTGWVSTTGTASRRKQVNMFAEGSVLNTTDEPVGRLVDLKPDNCAHPVYRYGYAWQVGIKVGANSESHNVGVDLIDETEI